MEKPTQCTSVPSAIAVPAIDDTYEYLKRLTEEFIPTYANLKQYEYNQVEIYESLNNTTVIEIHFPDDIVKNNNGILESQGPFIEFENTNQYVVNFETMEVYEIWKIVGMRYGTRGNSKHDYLHFLNKLIVHLSQQKRKDTK